MSLVDYREVNSLNNSQRNSLLREAIADRRIVSWGVKFICKRKIEGWIFARLLSWVFGAEASLVRQRVALKNKTILANPEGNPRIAAIVNRVLSPNQTRVINGEVLLREAETRSLITTWCEMGERLNSDALNTLLARDFTDAHIINESGIIELLTTLKQRVGVQNSSTQELQAETQAIHRYRAIPGLHEQIGHLASETITEEEFLTWIQDQVLEQRGRNFRTSQLNLVYQLVRRPATQEYLQRASNDPILRHGFFVRSLQQLSERFARSPIALDFWSDSSTEELNRVQILLAIATNEGISAKLQEIANCNLEQEGLQPLLDQHRQERVDHVMREGIEIDGRTIRPPALPPGGAHTELEVKRWQTYCTAEDPASEAMRLLAAQREVERNTGDIGRLLNALNLSKDAESQLDSINSVFARLEERLSPQDQQEGSFLRLHIQELIRPTEAYLALKNFADQGTLPRQISIKAERTLSYLEKFADASTKSELFTLLALGEECLKGKQKFSDPNASILGIQIDPRDNGQWKLSGSPTLKENTIIEAHLREILTVLPSKIDRLSHEQLEQLDAFATAALVGYIGADFGKANYPRGTRAIVAHLQNLHNQVAPRLQRSHLSEAYREFNSAVKARIEALQYYSPQLWSPDFDIEKLRFDLNLLEVVRRLVFAPPLYLESPIATLLHDSSGDNQPGYRIYRYDQGEGKKPVLLVSVIKEPSSNGVGFNPELGLFCRQEVGDQAATILSDIQANVLGSAMQRDLAEGEFEVITVGVRASGATATLIGDSLAKRYPQTTVRSIAAVAPEVLVLEDALQTQGRSNFTPFLIDNEQKSTVRSWAKAGGEFFNAIASTCVHLPLKNTLQYMVQSADIGEVAGAQTIFTEALTYPLVIKELHSRACEVTPRASEEGEDEQFRLTAELAVCGRRMMQEEEMEKAEEVSWFIPTNATAQTVANLQEIIAFIDSGLPAVRADERGELVRDLYLIVTDLIERHVENHTNTDYNVLVDELLSELFYKVSEKVDELQPLWTQKQKDFLGYKERNAAKKERSVDPSSFSSSFLEALAHTAISPLKRKIGLEANLEPLPLSEPLIAAEAGPVDQPTSGGVTLHLFTPEERGEKQKIIISLNNLGLAATRQGRSSVAGHSIGMMGDQPVLDKAGEIEIALKARLNLFYSEHGLRASDLELVTIGSGREGAVATELAHSLSLDFPGVNVKSFAVGSPPYLEPIHIASRPKNEHYTAYRLKATGDTVAEGTLFSRLKQTFDFDQSEKSYHQTLQVTYRRPTILEATISDGHSLPHYTDPIAWKAAFNGPALKAAISAMNSSITDPMPLEAAPACRETAPAARVYLDQEKANFETIFAITSAEDLMKKGPYEVVRALQYAVDKVESGILTQSEEEAIKAFMAVFIVSIENETRSLKYRADNPFYNGLVNLAGYDANRLFGGKFAFQRLISDELAADWNACESYLGDRRSAEYRELLLKANFERGILQATLNGTRFKPAGGGVNGAVFLQALEHGIEDRPSCLLDGEAPLRFLGVLKPHPQTVRDYKGLTDATQWLERGKGLVGMDANLNHRDRDCRVHNELLGYHAAKIFGFMDHGVGFPATIEVVNPQDRKGRVASFCEFIPGLKQVGEYVNSCHEVTEKATGAENDLLNRRGTTFSAEELTHWQMSKLLDFATGNMDGHEGNAFIAIRRGRIVGATNFDYDKAWAKKLTPGIGNQYKWANLQVSRPDFTPETRRKLREILGSDNGEGRIQEFLRYAQRNSPDHFSRDQEELLRGRMEVLRLIAFEGVGAPSSLADFGRYKARLPRPQSASAGLAVDRCSSEWRHNYTDPRPPSEATTSNHGLH